MPPRSIGGVYAWMRVCDHARLEPATGSYVRDGSRGRRSDAASELNNAHVNEVSLFGECSDTSPDTRLGKQFQAVNAEWFSEGTGLGSPGGATQVGPADKDDPTVAEWPAAACGGQILRSACCRESLTHSSDSSSSSGDPPVSTTMVWSSNEHHSCSILSNRARAIGPGPCTTRSTLARRAPGGDERA